MSSRRALAAIPFTHHIAWRYLLSCAGLSRLLLTATQVAAQSDTLAVVADDGAPLVGAVVQVFLGDIARPSQFLLTDSGGAACCIDIAKVDSLLVSHLTGGRHRVLPADLRRVDGLLWLKYPSVGIELPVATVTGRTSGIIIRGDTLVFDPSKFTDGREFDVNELVNQLPGLRVGPDGTVTFQGKPVERILLDGEDVVRSQFSMINNLVNPEEVKRARLIEERLVDGSERRTLDVQTGLLPAWRGNVAAGVSARARPKASANLLRQTPFGGWRGFLSGSLDYLGGSADSDGANLRERDFDVDALRRTEAVHDESEVREMASLPAVRGRDHLAQVQAQRQAGRSKSSVYLQMRQTYTERKSTSQVNSTLEGLALGAIERRDLNSATRHFVSAYHSDSLGRQTTVQTFLRATSSQAYQDVSGTSGLGRVSGGSYSIVADRSNLAALGGLMLRHRLGSYHLQIYATRQTKQSDERYSLSDSRPIYRSGSGIDSLNLRPIRKFNRQLFDVRLMRSFAKVEAAVGVQEHTDRLAERLDVNVNSLSPTAPAPQKIQSVLAFVDIGWRVGALGTDILLATHTWHYCRGDFQERLLSPKASASLSWKISRLWSAYSRVILQTLPFEPSDLWTTATPISTREYRVGYLAKDPFATHVVANFNVRRFTAGGSFSAFAVDLQSADQALAHVSNLREGYIEYTPVVVTAQQSYQAMAMHSLTVKRHTISLRTNMSRGESAFAAPVEGHLSNLIWSTSISAKSKWSSLLHLTAGADLRHATQSTLTGTARGDLRLTTVTPNIGADIRGRSLTFSLDVSTLLSPAAKAVPIMNVAIFHRRRDHPLSIIFSGNDLFNLGGSTFRTINFNSAEVSTIDFARRLGYFSLTATYKFADFKH